MHNPLYTLNTLFAQLGLDDSNAAIERFIATSRPLPPTQALHEAPCWNRAQADLLRESIACDADWAEVVDQLDALLRKS
jgi:hypothetical protein